MQSGYVDGGDVLRIGSASTSACSTRTDAPGSKALPAIAGPLGYEVVAARTAPASTSRPARPSPA